MIPTTKGAPLGAGRPREHGCQVLAAVGPLGAEMQGRKPPAAGPTRCSAPEPAAAAAAAAAAAFSFFSFFSFFSLIYPPAVAQGGARKGGSLGEGLARRTPILVRFAKNRLTAIHMCPENAHPLPGTWAPFPAFVIPTYPAPAPGFEWATTPKLPGTYPAPTRHPPR